MIMLEDSLREMFQGQVEAPPVAEDPAGTAIRRGRSARRRRAAVSSLAVAVALVLTIGGVMSVGGWPPGQGGGQGSVSGFDAGPADPVVTLPAEPPGPVEDNGIGLDLRVGDQLWTTDGRQLALTGVGEVTRVYRVPTGWVYAGVHKVRFLRPDGSSLSLSGEDDRWALSADGSRLAFLLGATLYIARIGPAGMAVVDNVQVPAGTWPVAFVGNRVVLSDGPRGYGIVDLAHPAQPTWNADVAAVYGVRGGTLVGLVRAADDSRRCLASLTPTAAALRPTETGGCALGLGVAAPDGRLAPGGTWLAERRGSEVALVNVERALAGEPTMLTCPVAATVPPVWADAGTVVTGDDRHAVRCRTDGTRQAVPLPDGVAQGWQPVPRLAAQPGAR